MLGPCDAADKVTSLHDSCTLDPAYDRQTLSAPAYSYVYIHSAAFSTTDLHSQPILGQVRSCMIVAVPAKYGNCSWAEFRCITLVKL
jgi:hypothetical protein